MKIKTPFGGEVEFNPSLCSKTLPDADGVLKTGYVATCPKTKGQFEVRVTITGIGSDNEQATIEAAMLPSAALLASARNARANEVRAAMEPSVTKLADKTTADIKAVAEAAGVTLPASTVERIRGTVKAAKLMEVVSAELAQYDETVVEEQKIKSVADKALVEAALAKAGG